MKLIGLSGYARSGKDSAASVLTMRYGFQHRAFADKLREFLLVLNPIVSSAYVVPTEGTLLEQVDGTKFSHTRLSEVIEHYGWDGYKESHYSGEIRELLQRLGTDCGRELISDNIWVNAALADLDSNGNYVFTDCRFPNEAEAILDFGGEIWRIKRDGVGPANAHPSETALDDWKFDQVIYNYGTLDDFHTKVRETYMDSYQRSKR